MYYFKLSIDFYLCAIRRFLFSAPVPMYSQPNKVAGKLDRFGLCDIRLDAALVALMVAVEVASRLLLSRNTAIVAAAHQLVK